MKISINSHVVFGYPYSVSEIDIGDPTEKIIELPDKIAKRWLASQKAYDIWQKEVDEYMDIERTK